MKPLLLSAIFLFISWTVIAQDISLQYFFVEGKGNKTYLRWATSAGSTCNGIIISRSIDGVQYNKIGEIFGVCGSEDSSQVFSYTDDTPLVNKTNFYKLTLGSQASTVIQSIFIIADGGYIFYPNPSRSMSKLHFDNYSADIATLNLYNPEGRIIYSSSTKGDIFEVNVEQLPVGMYNYIIVMPGKSHKGIFSVIH